MPSTEDPSSTTEEPTSTSVEPTSTQEEPTSTSEAPTSTETEPISTSEEPTSTSEEPISTSEEPTSTSEEPTSTSEQPTSTSDPSTESSVPSTESSVPTYTVTWLDEDGSLLRADTDVPEGTIPVYGPENPIKESDAQYTYAFSAWVPEIAPVTSNVTYTASYASAVRSYEVTWLDDDGTLLRTDTLLYGATPNYGSIPSKENTAQYTFSFASWVPEISSVTGEATYTASYNRELNSYTITWLDEDGTLLKNDSVAYGRMPFYGESPTKEGNEQYEYPFDKWVPNLSPVTGNATYTASYSETLKQYPITWLNDDGTVLKTENVPYGTTPDYGLTPTKEGNAQYSYAFDGWTPEVVPVTGAATYQATYQSTVNSYTITWLDDNGTLLKKTTVAYGGMPFYGDVPSKASDAQYDYSFSKWMPNLSPVTGNATYTASYDATPIAVSFPSPLYLTNNRNWANVYVYAWNAQGSNAAWPGKTMTFHKNNEYGQQVYSATGLSSYDSIIFNDGGSAQTVDISKTTIQGNNAYYIKDTTDAQGHYQVGTWKETGGSSINPSDKGLNILHCFDWSLANIKAHLSEIAQAGFDAVQTSPLQAVKDYADSYSDTNEKWWRFYQPVSLSVGNSTTNVLFSQGDGDAELFSLCEAAGKVGLRVIVDVVVNHLGDGSGNGGLHPSVASFEPDIYNDTSHTLHNYGPASDSSIKGIVYGDQTGKDLNTANSTVQRRVFEYLKELIDDGVTGFRFDAAKHIETSVEGDGCASSFWENTLGQARTYASSKSQPLYAYGEILNPSGDVGGSPRSYYNYIRYAGLNGVTDCIIGEKYRQSIASGFWTGVDAANNVAWGESHDDYCGDRHVTTSTDQSVVNNAYHGLAADQKDATLLYFARPDMSAKIGSLDAHPDWGWRSSYIAEANRSH